MSKTIDEVMKYANEDNVQIKKHWIIFVKMAIRVIAFVVSVWFVNAIGIVPFILELLGELIPILKHTTLIAVLTCIAVAAYEFVTTYITYTTVGLSANNIQIKGKTGLVHLGFINASLEQVQSIRAHIPFFGRMLDYGTIEINLNGSFFKMEDMVGVELFQEAIILLQEAQKEGRTLRSDERHDETVAKQTMAQVQAMGIISKTISKALPGANANIALESPEQALIENA